MSAEARMFSILMHIFSNSHPNPRGIHKGRPADPRGEGRKNRTIPDAGEGEGEVFEILGRPEAKKMFRIF